MARTLNRTNTNLTATATIAPGAATGGSARLLRGSTVLATDAAIGAADTSVTFDLGTRTPEALQAAVPQGAELTVVLRDAAGNESAASAPTALVTDFTLPQLLLASDRTMVPVGTTATITFTLDKAAANFTASDVTVTGGALTNFAGSGLAYTATFTPTPGAGGNAALLVAAALLALAAAASFVAAEGVVAAHPLLRFEGR